MKAQVEEWTGIPVSIGVAPTKTLAKLANYIAKKNKKSTKCIVVLATSAQQQEALQQTRLNNIWGVGRASADKLFNLGLTSGWDLACMPEEWAHRHLGGVVGVRLIRELRGEPSVDMKKELTEKKMIATTRMFGSPVNNILDIKEAIATYTSRAAEKLRRQHSAAKTISVFIVKREDDHSYDFSHGQSLTDYTTLPAATSVTQELIKPALELIDHIYIPGHEYKKAGVMLSGLVPEDSIQGNLFSSESNPSHDHRKLMDMLDNINFSQRDDILKFASSGTTRDWKMRQELRSSRYTTRWDEMYNVK
jgi:DNA polymerase V